MIRRIILTGLLVAIVAAPSAFARGDDNDTVTTTETNPSSPTVKPDDDNAVEQEDTNDDSSADRARQEDRIERRKAEFRDRLEEKSAERKEKLDARRLERCEKRQENINKLIDKGTEVGRERLAHIQHVEAAVKSFYAKKGLSGDQYDAALLAVDEKEAAAVAALDVITERNFDCNSVDAADPSGEIKRANQEKRDALAAYRESVKDLIKVVKADFVASQQAQNGEGQ